MMLTNLDATELLNYNKSEERKMEEMMEGIAATGVKAGTSPNSHTCKHKHTHIRTHTSIHLYMYLITYIYIRTLTRT
jgi:hypothetical protein